MTTSNTSNQSLNLEILILKYQAKAPKRRSVFSDGHISCDRVEGCLL